VPRDNWKGLTLSAARFAAGVARTADSVAFARRVPEFIGRSFGGRSVDSLCILSSGGNLLRGVRDPADKRREQT
jgi:hypothetical protein